jgi:hypothetical protein
VAALAEVAGRPRAAGKVATQLRKDGVQFGYEAYFARTVAFLILGGYIPSLLQILASIEPLYHHRTSPTLLVLNLMIILSFICWSLRLCMLCVSEIARLVFPSMCILKSG